MAKKNDMGRPTEAKVTPIEFNAEQQERVKKLAEQYEAHVEIILSQSMPHRAQNGQYKHYLVTTEHGGVKVSMSSR